MKKRRTQKKRKGLILDLPEEITFQGKVFQCPYAGSGYRARMEQFILNKGGKVQTNITQGVDYLIINFASCKYGEIHKNAVEMREHPADVKIISINDLMQLEQGDIEDGFNQTSEAEAPAVREEYGYELDIVRHLEFKGKNFAFARVGAALKEQHTAFIEEHGGIVKPKFSYQVDYLIVDTRLLEKPEAYEDALHLKKKSPLLILDTETFCELTGFKMDPDKVDEADLTPEALEAKKELTMYYLKLARTDGAYYSTIRKLSRMSSNLLLELALEKQVYDAPIVPNDNGQPYCFVSFNRKNAVTVKPMIRQMQADGCRVWCTEQSAEEIGVDVLNDRIANADVFLALYSAEYLDSEQQIYELNTAKECGKRIILTFIDDSKLEGGMKLKFGRYQMLDLQKLLIDDFYAKLYGSESFSAVRVCPETGDQSLEQTEEPAAEESADVTVVPDAPLTEDNPEADEIPAAAHEFTLVGEHPAENEISVIQVGAEADTVLIEVSPGEDETLTALDEPKPDAGLIEEYPVEEEISAAELEPEPDAGLFEEHLTEEERLAVQVESKSENLSCDEYSAAKEVPAAPVEPEAVASSAEEYPAAEETLTAAVEPKSDAEIFEAFATGDEILAEPIAPEPERNVFISPEDITDMRVELARLTEHSKVLHRLLRTFALKMDTEITATDNAIRQLNDKLNDIRRQ